MTRREIIRMLTDAGYTLVREGKRHSLYGKAGVLVPVPHGSKPLSYRNERNFLRDLRRPRTQVQEARQ